MHPKDPAVRRLVVEDLQVKSDACRRSPTGMSVTFPLTVRTWAPAASQRSEVSQWNVMYLSAPLALRSRKGHSFPAFSSPTTIRLPPGKYVVWAEDPADKGRVGPPKDVTLGEAVAVDLIVPGK